MSEIIFLVPIKIRAANILAFSFFLNTFYDRVLNLSEFPHANRGNSFHFYRNLARSSFFYPFHMQFSTRLLHWYHQHHRDLPWRQTKNPYFVWLSEVILQQTRVAQGMAYYEKFIRLFPTVADLACASEDMVLKAWQGLGYYSRARNLHAAAQVIHFQLHDQFPTSKASWIQLPGIGDYTASAIASFCYNEPTPAIDGNVIRVISRLFGVEDPVDKSVGKKRIEAIAQSLIDNKQPGMFNQAMMEFGAIQCTPDSPDCDSCPFRTQCTAFALQGIQRFPVKSSTTRVKSVWLYYFFLQHNQKTYVIKRVKTGIWKGLYDLPCLEFDHPQEVQDVIDRFSQQYQLPDQAHITEVTQEWTHILSHRKLKATFITIQLNETWYSRPEEILEIEENTMPQFGVSRLIDKFLQSRKFAVKNFDV